MKKDTVPDMKRTLSPTRLDLSLRGHIFGSARGIVSQTVVFPRDARRKVTVILSDGGRVKGEIHNAEVIEEEIPSAGADWNHAICSRWRIPPSVPRTSRMSFASSTETASGTRSMTSAEPSA